MNIFTTLILACALMLTSQSQAIELVDGKPMLTVQEFEQLKICQSAGGCYIVTLKALEAMVDKTIEVTLVELARRIQTCRKDTI